MEHYNIKEAGGEGNLKLLNRLMKVGETWGDDRWKEWEV